MTLLHISTGFYARSHNCKHLSNISQVEEGPNSSSTSTK